MKKLWIGSLLTVYIVSFAILFQAPMNKDKLHTKSMSQKTLKESKPINTASSSREISSRI